MAPRSLDASTFVTSTKIGNFTLSSVSSRCLVSSPLSSVSSSSGKSRCLFEVSLIFTFISFYGSIFHFSAHVLLQGIDLVFGNAFFEQVGGYVVHVRGVGHLHLSHHCWRQGPRVWSRLLKASRWSHFSLAVKTHYEYSRDGLAGMQSPARSPEVSDQSASIVDVKTY